MNTIPSSGQLIEQLQTLTQGLLWPSETDAPIDVIHWESPDHQGLLGQILQAHGDSELIEAIALSHLFRHVTQVRDWYGETETAQAQKFQQIEQLLTQLQAPQAYRVGSVEVTVYALGFTEDSQIVGLKTLLVET